jgi:hypothetical protein
MSPTELIVCCQGYAAHCWLLARKQENATDKQTLIDIAKSCIELAARVKVSKSLFELSGVTDREGPRTIH